MDILKKSILKWTASWDKTERPCDGCGEPYPITHMTYSFMYDGHFCDRCNVYEEEE